jgi:hypothetical protein
MPSLDDRVQSLARRLDAIESRLATLETRPAPVPAAGEEPAARPDAATERLPALDARRWTTALGRSFIVLGGAFLLRALTDAGVWRPGAGVTLGLLYALVWIGASVRASRQSDRVLGAADGAIALVIGFPLIVEATLRFRLFTPPASAVVLGVFAGLVLTSASATRLQSLAWLTTAGGMITGFGLMVRTGVVAPYAVYFIGLGVAALWLGYLREWKGLRWPAGWLAVIGAVGVTSRALTQPPSEPAATAWLVQALLFIGYLASIAVRTLVRGRQVIPFEVVQTSLVLMTSVSGALAVSRASGTGATALGTALVALGASAYLVSFPFLPRESRGALNFYFYSTLALVLVLVGVGTALSGPAQAMALTAFAALLAAAWSRTTRVSLGAHAALALVAASALSGLLTLGEGAFVGPLPPVAGLWTAGPPLALAVLLAGSRVASAHTPTPAMRDAPAVVITALGLGGLAGVLTVGAAAGAEALAGITLGEGGLATVRTAILSICAVACARLARPGRFSAAGPLAYPLLLATGAKLLMVDLRESTAATLFVALACYGVSLVLLPRLCR